MTSINSTLLSDAALAEVRAVIERHGAAVQSVGHPTMTLEAPEFIRRFLLHVLPVGFQHLRSYGFLGNRYRDTNRHGHSYTDADRHGDADAHRHAHSYSYGDAHRHSHGDAYADCNCNADANGYADGHTYSNADRYRQPNPGA